MGNKLNNIIKNNTSISTEANTSATNDKLKIEELLKEIENIKVCPICYENDKEYVLNCGHTFCKICVEKVITECYVCRKRYRYKVKFFV
jgi:hypothetical protein